MLRFAAIELDAIGVLLCDADGNLFPSEEPAFSASAGVTNRFLAAFGASERFTSEELRRTTTGKNFRTTAVDLALACGIPLEPTLIRERASGATRGDVNEQATVTVAGLERWVLDERRTVTAHLRGVLRPDPEVLVPLTQLSRDYSLAAVSSSALSRLDACFAATGLDRLIPDALRFSAEDSLPEPTSKPDPAIYRFAADRLGVLPHQALAIEDAVPGAQSALAAGFQTIGNVQFVPAEERAARIDALRRVGVAAIVTAWKEIDGLLRPRHRQSSTHKR